MASYVSHILASLCIQKCSQQNQLKGFLIVPLYQLVWKKSNQIMQINFFKICGKTRLQIFNGWKTNQFLFLSCSIDIYVKNEAKSEKIKTKERRHGSGIYQSSLLICFSALLWYVVQTNPYLQNITVYPFLCKWWSWRWLYCTHGTPYQYK